AIRALHVTGVQTCALPIYPPRRYADGLGAVQPSRPALQQSGTNGLPEPAARRMAPAMSSTYDVIVLGAGAAGLMCAAQAGARGRRVLLLEHADRPGKKILISGGGRCNFTNVHTAPERFLSANAHFAKSAL